MMIARSLFNRVSTKSIVKPSCSRFFSTEKPWEDPWKHAVPKQEQTFTDFKESSVDWSYVERLMPVEQIPPMPLNCGVLPSGWQPPRDPAPDLPYFIGRTRYHMPALYLERRRDKLNPETMDFDYVELVVMKEVSGDVFACEKNLRTFLETKVSHPVATFVDELKGIIKVKGAERALLEEFIYQQGF